MLKKVARTAPQPLGFKIAPAAAGPQMALIAALASSDGASALADRIEGADAVLFGDGTVSPDAKAVRKMSAALRGLPWGAWLKDADEAGAQALVAAGADFLVVPDMTPVSVTSGKGKSGRVLLAETSLADSLLRAINDLEVDAVMLATPGGSLTWRGLMDLQRAANVLSRPLLASAPATLSASELEALWEAGVDALVVRVSKELPAGGLKDLGDKIAGLKGLRRKRGHAEALVPRLKVESAREEEDEGDEDE